MPCHFKKRKVTGRWVYEKRTAGESIVNLDEWFLMTYLKEFNEITTVKTSPDLNNQRSATNLYIP